MWFYFLWAVVILVEIQTVSCFDIFYFQDHCGTTINSNAGEVRFNAKRLVDNECSVTVRMEKVEYNDVQMFFYFTKFNFHLECADSNVSLVDGYKGKYIDGLPRYLCGQNGTLVEEGQYFETKDRQMTVTFNRSVYGERFSGDFCIKFLEFHTHLCPGKTYGRCLDERCIERDYHCSDDIRGCGADSCRQDEERISSFLSSVQTLGFILAVAVVVYLLKHVYVYLGNCFKMRRRRSRYSPRQSVDLDESPTENIQIHTEAEPLNSTRRHISPSLVSEQYESINDEDDVSLSSEGNITSSNNQTTSNDYDVKSLPSVPPPSYEMARHYET